eukprot:COSAG06_NODE_12245_length_1404_cov_1.298084_1_plen_114_part_00
MKRTDVVEVVALERSLQENGTFGGVFPMFVPRACLGKMIFSMEKVDKKCRLLTLRPSYRCLRLRPLVEEDRSNLYSKRTLFEFSLCLSRACLGKKIVFIYKWRQKVAFFTPCG